ncbi:MAG TPA: kynureninase, partial [Bacteroidia bacterium]|nr:kynureninase [Bacteroidia bacterium]
MSSSAPTLLKYENSLDFAKQMDALDPLKKYREQFYFPQLNNRDVVYFSGNYLGLQPKSTQDHVLNQMEDWASFGYQANQYARTPWDTYHMQLIPPLAKIAGAQPSEVTVMNQLSINLHLMLVSFYRPDKKRYKILCEKDAFPSDQYAMESQVQFHGFDPEDAIIMVSPREGEYCIQPEDILEAIEKNKDSLALVLISGANYYTGQIFDMQGIAAAAHRAGALVGFDLAHAIGNVKLQLHDWDVDFAVWCSYKYLNAGPGGIGGIFIHERHVKNLSVPRFAGRLGVDTAARPKREKGFIPTPTAEGWQLGALPILLIAAHKAALDQFEEVGIDALIAKSEKLTGYLEFIIEDFNNSITQPFEIITPRKKEQRGCQLSVAARGR